MVQEAQDVSYRSLLSEPGIPEEVERLTRLVAACELLDEAESVLDDFEPRLATIQARLWTEAPFTQFRQRSSVGAFLVTRYAVAWVPDGLALRRHAPLGRDAFAKTLTDAGLGPGRAEALLGPWRGPEATAPSDEEVEVGILAGLAERSLTGPERDHALSRVAWSPRDLARLVASAKLVDRIRCALPWAPPKGLTVGVAIAAADVPYRQPRRRVRLLASVADPWVRAVVDLAETEDALRRGDGAALAQMLKKAEDEPDTADLPERGTQDDLPVLTEAEARLDPRGACLGLRPRRGGIHAHAVPGSNVGEGALLAAVRAIRLQALRALDGQPPTDLKSTFWERRIRGLASAAAGDLDAARDHLDHDDPELRWLEPLRLRGFDEIPKDACRHQAAELIRDLTASMLSALSGDLVEDAE